MPYFRELVVFESKNLNGMIMGKSFGKIGNKIENLYIDYRYSDSPNLAVEELLMGNGVMLTHLTIQLLLLKIICLINFTNFQRLKKLQIEIYGKNNFPLVYHGKKNNNCTADFIYSE